MSYQAIVCRVSVRPHPNADKLKIGTCSGAQVIVGLETQEGELGVYFPEDGALSHDFCLQNSLYSRSALEKLGVATEDGGHFGFFSEKRRVRAQSFRGVKSEGFWVPLTYLSYADGSLGEEEILLLKEGTLFDTFNGQLICEKYETPATRNAGSNRVGRRQRENLCFPKHDVSKKFKFVNRMIPDGAVCWITEKLHGTSGRYGYVLDEVERGWFTKTCNRLLGWEIFPSRVYRYLNGSKNVILEKSTGSGWYGTNDFRYKAIEGVTLHKGEILYFEIVGFVPETGAPIMHPHPIKDDLKELKKTYGQEMCYWYGVDGGTCDIYVYKIVRINEDGKGTDLSWNQVKARTRELGLKHVPELAGPFIHKLDRDDPTDGLVETLTEGASTLDASHIREGVVLRTEAPDGIDYIKNKSWTFGVLEGYIKDDEEYVDTEEAS